MNMFAKELGSRHARVSASIHMLIRL